MQYSCVNSSERAQQHGEQSVTATNASIIIGGIFRIRILLRTIASDQRQLSTLTT